jgi:hypothetical protein
VEIAAAVITSQASWHRDIIGKTGWDCL